MTSCPYCNRRHQSDAAYERCLDRFEASYDELEALEAEHPLIDEGNRVLITLLMRGEDLGDLSFGYGPPEGSKPHPWT